VGFCGFWTFFLGFRPCFLPPGPILEPVLPWRISVDRNLPVRAVGARFKHQICWGFHVALCKFIGFGDVHGPKPYKFVGFGDVHGPKPYKFIRFGDVHGPKPYKFIGFGGSMYSFGTERVIQLRFAHTSGRAGDNRPWTTWWFDWGPAG
jgi:hypothetical protein